MNRRAVTWVSACVLAGFAGESWASRVQVWNASSASHYEKARFKHTVISNEGAIRLARQLHPLAGLDATHVWAVAEDGQGNLLVATGDEGKLYRVSRDGKVSVAYDSQESQVLCLATAPDGSVYAGTGPGGLIVRLPPGGPGRVIYRIPETYIWSLAYDAHRDVLFAGTGPRGRIYRVTPDGKGSVFYATKQEHILALATGAGDSLYAGTDKAGLVYRIDGRGKAFVLYQAPQAEVRSLLVTPAGVYAGTSSPSHRRSLAPAAALDHPADQAMKAVAPPLLNHVSAKFSTEELTSSAAPKEHEADRAHHGIASAPLSGENSLYQISPDGSVREVFRDRAMVLSLLARGDRLLVGTGMEGQLFEVDPLTRERTELARLDHGQIHSLYRRQDGAIIVGTGDPGKLYVLEERHARAGSVISEPHDARMTSRWGSMRWKADTPAGTALTVAVRSGNVAEPDETWSDWSAEQSDPALARAVAPPARFLQYRVTLRTSDAAITPTLQSLAIRYATANQAPEVASVEVPDMDATNHENSKRMHFRWTASDPNDDDLTYAIYVRRDGWKDWAQLEEGLEKKEFDWDTTSAPSGVYRLKVVASDRRDNSAEEALTGERVSVPFVVAHEAPAVKVRVTAIHGREATLEATATDPLVRLTSASFAVNGKRWIGVFPVDGLFDSKSESFRFKTGPLKAGTHVLVLRVTDAAGNTGSADVVFALEPAAGPR